MTNRVYEEAPLTAFPPVVRLKYKKGDLICKEGAYGNVLYRLVSGHVRIFMSFNELLVSLAVLGEGEIIGEGACLNQCVSPYSFSARAMEDSEIEIWHIDTLNHHLDGLTPMMRAIFEQPLRRLSRTRGLIQQLTRRKMTPHPEEMRVEKEAGEGEAHEPVVLDDQGMDTALTEHLSQKRKEWAAQKRRHYRKRVDIRAAYRPMFASKKSDPASGLIRDVSREGLGMEVLSEAFASFSHDVGDRFDIDFQLPNNQPIHLEAIVVSKREGRLPHSSFLGMYITHITYENQKRLGFFLMP